ncbi:hypothetical protein [Lysobacter sp. ESA13C]|uniref:hypothetical protein n=1 Tax=Lysobacter sp. ESA13C TaxID=2862676 RepID=UPI001CBD1115|nr:hypothetical protein [Lysobacter sp. ESA13C]
MRVGFQPFDVVQPGAAHGELGQLAGARIENLQRGVGRNDPHRVPGGRQQVVEATLESVRTSGVAIEIEEGVTVEAMNAAIASEPDEAVRIAAYVEQLRALQAVGTVEVLEFRLAGRHHLDRRELCAVRCQAQAGHCPCHAQRDDRTEQEPSHSTFQGNAGDPLHVVCSLVRVSHPGLASPSPDCGVVRADVKVKSTNRP